jgi:thioredoxin reductase (NADPH)
MENVIIIGSGPAGLTSAIYTARALLKPLMIEGFEAGGQLMTTTDVENFPGFPEGIMGPDMMMNFKKQAQRFDTRIVSKDVTKVDFSQKPYKVWVGEEVHETKSVIISTGAKAKTLGLENEWELMGKGVSTCATCDGAFFRDQEIVIVGGGDSAMEEAMFLTRFASKVTVVVRRDVLRASQIMQQKAKANPKIHWIWNHVVEKIHGEKEVRGLTLKSTKDESKQEIACTGLFMAIGHVPNTQLFEGQIQTHDNGYIKTFEGTQTNVEGVFAAGDVQDFTYRQAITAAGSGCKAAMDCERYLENLPE